MIFNTLAFIGLILFIAAFIALINPRWVKAPKSSRILGFLLYFTLSMFVAGAGSAFMTPEQKAKREADMAAFTAKKTAEDAEKQKAYEASELKKTREELERVKAEAEKAKNQAAQAPVQEQPKPAEKTDAEKVAELQAALRKKVEEMKAEGAWELQEDTSKVDDTKSVWLIAGSNKPVIGRYNRQSWGKLVLRCLENKTDVLLTYEQYLSTRDLDVITRLDKEKASNRTWNITTDNQGLLHPSPVEFIRQLEKHDALYIQLTPYSSDPVEMEFNLRGLDKLVGKLKDSCHWQ